VEAHATSTSLQNGHLAVAIVEGLYKGLEVTLDHAKDLAVVLGWHRADIDL